MKKIPTIFLRNFTNGGRITREWNPACLRIRDGDGVAYVKWDGTACMVRDTKLFKRYDAKRGKMPPAGFEPCGEPDKVTGHHPGWLPVGYGPDDRWHREAWARADVTLPDGTYELCGPKLQGNPERMPDHYLIPHLSDECKGFPRDYAGMAAWFAAPEGPGVEGVVFWLGGEPFAKIKSRDFGLTWPRPL